MTFRRWHKYFAFARIGFRSARAEPAELYGRVLFLGVILGVFSALWRAVGESGMPGRERPGAFVWYLALTEWVLLSAPQVQFQIEAQVRRGDVAYELGRPASYLGCQLAEATGVLVLRAPVLLAAAFAWAALYTGGLPEEAQRLLYAVPFGLAACFVLLALNVTVGLSAFWLGDVAPIHWVVQKLGFVLGGLMLPLALYPRWLAELASFTPFPSLLYGPASFVVGAPLARAPALALSLAGWLTLILVTAALLLRRAARRMALNGG